MLIGTLHISKAYLGSTELTPTNAFIGTTPIIEDAPETSAEE
jgi:hypothetical protein